MALEIKKGTIVNLGEPIGPDHHFYANAVEFRSAVQKLGLSGTSVVRELVKTVTPELGKLDLSKSIAKLEIEAVLFVTYSDGSRQRIATKKRKGKK